MNDQTIVIGRIALRHVGEELQITLIDKPGVVGVVSAGQLERWAMRQLRENVFAVAPVAAPAEAA